MQLTTPQLYALFSMIVATIVLIGITYLAGLRTGRKAGQANGYDLGRSTAAKYWKGIIAGIRENQGAIEQGLLKKLDGLRTAHERAIAETMATIKQLAAEQNATARLDNVIGRLQARALTPEDVLNIKLAARQLAIAAKHISRSGTNKPNQAHLASVFLTEIAGRYIEAAPVAEPTARQPFERDENGFALPPRINYIGDGKDTWQRVDEERTAQGLPPAQCL